MQNAWRGNEDSNDHCAGFGGVGVRGVWFERVFAFYSCSVAARTGGPVFDDIVRVEMGVLHQRGSSSRRAVVAGEPVCAARASSAGAGSGQYIVVSRAAQPSGMATRSCDGDFVDLLVLAL